ncbi:MAG: hypothetical protein ACLFRO_08585 [Desulfobacterales bacterium]
MKKVVTDKGDISIQNVSKPEPAKNEILVKVYAAGLNRIDLILAEAPKSVGNV